MQHFKFTNWNATCEYCDYEMNIYQGTDVLRSHLDKYHNINKYSKEGTDGNNADDTTICRRNKLC